MEKKQTAVEWLMDKMLQNENGIFIGGRYLTLFEIRERAKAREKQQMIQFAMELHKRDLSKTGIDILLDEAHQLYFETFEL